MAAQVPVVEGEMRPEWECKGDDETLTDAEEDADVIWLCNGLEEYGMSGIVVSSRISVEFLEQESSSLREQLTEIQEQPATANAATKQSVQRLHNLSAQIIELPSSVSE